VAERNIERILAVADGGCSSAIGQSPRHAVIGAGRFTNRPPAEEGGPVIGGVDVKYLSGLDRHDAAVGDPEAGACMRMHSSTAWAGKRLPARLMPRS